MQRVGFGSVELRVPHAGAGAHILHAVPVDDTVIAHAVLVLEFTIEHVGHDIHIPMRMRREAFARSDAVVVEHAQATPLHALGIEVVGKAEAMRGLQPAMIAVIPFRAALNFHEPRNLFLKNC
jgi:hypothetical protein